MVALSVSISANTSPLVTLSPIFLCHPAITPSVMVSLKRGINTTSSIALRSATAVAVAVGMFSVDVVDGIAGADVAAAPIVF